MKMGLMLAGAAAGLGSGVASLASKYIDAEMADQKARRLAEIEREFAGYKREDEAKFSDQRAPIERQRRTEDTIAAGQASDTVALNRAGNTGLTQALIDQKNAEVSGTADAVAGAAGKKAMAEDQAKSYDLSPGQQRGRDGKVIAENSRPTSQEVQASLYERGLKASGARANPVERMSEAGKVQLQGIEKRDAALQQLIDKGLAEGTLSEKPTGPDGKPSPGYDQYQAVLRQRQSLGVSRQRLLATEGVIDGGDDAERLIKMGASPAELEASVAQAKQIGGEYAQSFAAAVEPALSKARSTDSKQAAIRAAAERNGDKSYRTDINGQKGEVGTPTRSRSESAPEYVPPADSLVGKARARMAQQQQQREQGEADKRQQAAQAFDALQPGDRSGAARLQASPLFDYLPKEQQRAIYNIVNGR